MYGWFVKQFINFLKFKISKVHKIVTKLAKAEKGGGNTINMSSLNQEISELVFVKPIFRAEIALKYGKDMEIEPAHTYIEIIKGKYNARTQYENA